MSVTIIQDRLDAYQCRNEQEEDAALREITQEIALAGLSRTDFFKYVAFQGGTCLRIFYGLNRFSEDMDFILKAPQNDFDLDTFLQGMKTELRAYGYALEIVDKSRDERAVKKAFIKNDSICRVLTLRHMRFDRSKRAIKIKVEVDTNPPSGGGFEVKYLTFPFSAAVVVNDAPSLFAGKMHALLCREYVKGRDWYDLIWYVSRNTRLNYAFLSAALDQVGPWKGQKVTVDTQWCMDMLSQKISAMDWPATVKDVEPFVRGADRPSLSVWSKDFFLSLVREKQACFEG